MYSHKQRDFAGARATFELEVVNSLGNSSVDFISVTVGQIGIYAIEYTDDIGPSDDDCYQTLYENEEVTVNGIVTVSAVLLTRSIRVSLPS